MKLIAKLSTLLALVLALSGGARTALASARDAEVKAKKAAFALLRAGYKNRARFHGAYLRVGARKIIRTVFHSGNEYKVVANGDADARNIDVEIYDEDWNLVDRDKDDAGVAMATATPTWTGQFYVVVTLKAAHGNAAYHNTLIVFR